MTSHLLQNTDLPGGDLDFARMPGHWLLARLGKRVLRPGGFGVTQAMLDDLSIAPDDEIVEFAPGLGMTARRILNLNPKRYTGVERDSQAAAWVKRQLPQAPNVSIVNGTADNTGLPAGCASIVVGEAMLTMNAQDQRRKIVDEAFRLLRPGGRYGIHELCIVPDEMDPSQQQQIDRDLSSTIHVGARPLRSVEWKELFERSGFHVIKIGYAPMHLLRLKRLIEDEGLIGALRIVRNIVLNPKARKRVRAMRGVFEHYRQNLNAIYIIAEK